MHRGVDPKNIILAIPDPVCHIDEHDPSDQTMKSDLPVIYPDAFEDEQILQKIQAMCMEKGITIITDIKLVQICTDKDREAKNERKERENTYAMQDIDASDINDEFQGVANLEKVIFKKLNEEDDEEEEDEEEYDNKSNSDNMSGVGAMTGDDSQMDDDGKSDDNEKPDKRKTRKKKN